MHFQCVSFSNYFIAHNYQASMKKNIYSILFAITLTFNLLGQELSSDEAVVSAGKNLFMGNCQQCHAIHEQIVGPKLANVYERRTIPWLINFIKYPQRVIDGGDPYAVKLYKQYKQYMPNHDFFSDEEILSILSYIKAETDNPTAKAAAATATSATAATTENGNDGLLIGIITGLIVVLGALVIVLFVLGNTLANYLKVDKTINAEGLEFVNQYFSFKKFVTSSGFLAIVGFVLLGAFTQATLEGLYTVGVQQGYAPDQPIPFSHKLHAGYYEIPCQYCHTSVEKSKNANIPSANICMNCHNAIRTTAPNIQKIYSAIEKNEPIKWVRVHNLPDLAYFNHAPTC